MKSKIAVLALTASIFGCAHNPSQLEKKVVDNAELDSVAPDWAKSSKISWYKDGYVFFKSRYTVRGDQRLNGCYQLAKLDTKQALLTEMSEDIKGALDVAEENLNEESELVFQQVRSSSFGGQVSGLRFLEQYHERYLVDDQQRVECFVLARMSISDYKETKRKVVHKIASSDPQLKQMIRQKGVKFFESQIPGE